MYVYRSRIQLNPKQNYVLSSYYLIDPRPCRELVDQIALDAGLPVKTVRTWFTNKRGRTKKSLQGKGSQTSSGSTTPCDLKESYTQSDVNIVGKHRSSNMLSLHNILN
ncbi:hypothetical protein K502DRAFT_365464 [Neoconidiobolus thromboides FSU 785]|nr:hypothetical protein K502DRAFT_365464 [Neoconidiobolus thromboides FSU 785]